MREAFRAIDIMQEVMQVVHDYLDLRNNVTMSDLRSLWFSAFQALAVQVAADRNHAAVTGTQAQSPFLSAGTKRLTDQRRLWGRVYEEKAGVDQMEIG